MDKEYILELYNNLGGESSFGKYSDFEKLITTDVQYQKDFHSSFGKGTLGDFKDFSSLVQKKNSNSTGSQTPKVSQSIPQPKPSTSVGGKQPQVKPSATSSGESDLINKFGLKPGEKIEGVERKAYEAQRNQPKLSVAKKQDIVETKSVSKGLDKKLDAKYEEISQIPVKQNKQFIQDFRNATAITPDYESQVRQEVQDELQGKGVWNTITQGASNLWNKVVPYIPGAPFDEKELEKLKSDVTFLPKAKEEYKNSLLKQGIKEEEITDDILTKGAIELEVNKRIEDKRLSLVNDYLDSISDEVKDSMELNTLREKDLKSPEVKRQYDILLTLDKDLEEDNSELLKLEKIAEEQGGLNEEQLNSYNSILYNVKNKIETRNKLYSSYEKNVSDLTTLEEEYDLFKRSYGFEDKAGKLLNAVADFGLGVLQFANMVQRGPTQDLIAMELAGIKNNKDKVVAEKLQKQVEDSENVNDILDYSADVLISQVPNIAMGYLTGGTSMLVGIGVSSTGNKYSELLQSNIEGKTDYSKLQLYLASGLYGGAEMLESNTLRMIGGGKRLISKALKNEPSRKLFKESLSTKTFNTGKEFLKNYKGELKEEFTTFGAQKLTDIVVLDIDSKDVFKNGKEEIKSLVKDTGVMVVGLNLFPATMSKVINIFTPKEYTYNLDKNNKRIEELSKILNNKDASDLAKKEAKENIDKIVKTNEEGLNKIIKNTSKLSDDLIDKVIELEIDSSNLRNKANEINNDKSITKKEKASLLSGLKEKFVQNETLREDIITGRKKSFDILPEEESTKLKSKAADELKAEALANGIEESKVNITEEQVNQRARENYEKQFEETTAKEPTEEGPKGKQEVESVTTTQGQQDKVVQEKNKVEELRVQELVELREQVENAEDFITDGKVDANKIAKSDNAKAKEIYAKYDAQIKPLLDNIKTQEDAIQKQSTGEGVLRPEQSEMGLQEVVEGDQESKITTEEVKSEEEITKIKTDLEASKERLNKAFNQYRNVNIAFDPKNQLAKDKELVKALLDYTYNNIRLGKYNAAKLIEDLAKDGIEITRDGAKYIFDRASKRVQREVNKAAGVKPKSTEQKRINKAYSIGVADQKVETQKQKDKTKEVKSEMSELKKQFNDVVSAIKTEKDIVKKESLKKQADKLNKKIADLREKSKAEVSELKDQIKDIFSSAKEAMKNQTDRAKTIKGIKKQISDFIKDNLSNFDAKDINKAQQKALLNALVAVDDVNFEEVLGDVLDVFEGVESKKEENINKAYNKVINKIIKPSFYTVSEGKVKKTKITDKYKQKIKEAIDKFSKIKNPTTKQKEDFINEMSDLKNKGVKERNSIDEKIKDDKQRKASRVAIDLLNKNKSVLPETTLDTTNELAVDDAFALGGVIFDGIVYPNTLVGKSKFKEAAGKGNVKVKPYKAFKSTRTDKQISIKERIKRFLRGSALRNFGLASFNLALKYDKSSAEFIEENFDAPMRRFATDRIKIKSIFTANRNKFFFDLGIDLKKSKSQLAQYIKGKKEVMFPSKKDGGIFLFINHPTMFKLNGKDVRYADVIADFDKRISEEKDQVKKDSILAEKEKFEFKYKSFEGLRDEHIVDLFNMIRQPDGLGKFLNNYTEDVALMVADYVNSNPGLRKMADKAIDLYKPVAKQMNPVLDKLGYDTFNDKKYSKKEDEIAVVNNSNLSQEEKDRRIEKIEKEYKIFNAIYPEGIPEFIPYYPISAETEVSISDDAKFFEDGATNDYSLVFPNLITRKSGGSLVFGKNGILNKYEIITDDATNFIAGHEIMGLSQELFTGTSGSLLKDKLGESFVSRAKTEVLNVLKNKSAGESVSQIIDKNPLFKFIYKTQGLQTAGELLINFKSALFQLAGVSVTYAKNPSALKLIPNLILTKEGRKELAMAYNLLNSSQELTDRINHKKDSAEVKILETIDKSNNTDLSFATALVHDFMVLTTYADYLSILLTTPVYINKANEYAKKNQGISKASALIQTIPSFFADEINTTLQSNDSYYMGSNFKNGLSLLLGVGKYVQAPRQLTMLSVNEITDAYNNRKSIAEVSGKVFMYSVVGVVLTKLLADSVFGDDEDEEKLSEADKETKRIKQINEIANSLLISSGLGGESLATLKDFYLANEMPEVLGFTKPKGDLTGFDYFNLIAKNNFKNISVPLRNLDAVLDNREIYSNTDQALAALQFGTGTPLFKLKKHSDYLTALAKQELTYREYWKFFTNQYKITDFKKIETEMNRYSKILEVSYRKYSDPKNKILNDNFLNSEERKMMSGMSNEEKVSFLENVRLNKIAQDFTLKYQEQMNMLKENKNVSKFFDVRKARFEENMTEEVYKLIENKVKYVTGGISEEDALLINKEVRSNVLNSKDEFKTKENLSDSELDAILESVANKVNKKVESEYSDTSAKMLKEFTAGKKKARAVYNLYKFAKEKGIENRYMQVISEELDDKTLGEFERIIKEEGL